jgi:hypothetical protein
MSQIIRSGLDLAKNTFSVCGVNDSNDAARRLAQVPGIGAITAAALVTTIGKGRDFMNGRQFAAWLGLVPRQYSTGGQAKLGPSPSAGMFTCEHC